MAEEGSPASPASKTTTGLLSSSPAHVHVACAEQPVCETQECGTRRMVGAVMDGQSIHTPAASRPIAAIVAFLFTDYSSGLFSEEQCGAVRAG